MANYANLKAAVNAAITTNGNNEITGAILNDILNSIISTIGGNYTLAGVVTPSTTISAPDANVFWIGGAGTYTQFGGTITIAVGNIGVFTYNGSYTREEIVVASTVAKSIGYYECRTGPATANKVVSASGFVLQSGGSIKVWFLRENAIDNPTLNINGTGAYPIYLSGKVCSPYNTWNAGDIVEFFYDDVNSLYIGEIVQVGLVANSSRESILSNDLKVNGVIERTYSYPYSARMNYSDLFDLPAGTYTLSLSTETPVSEGVSATLGLRYYPSKDSYANHANIKEVAVRNGGNQNQVVFTTTEGYSNCFFSMYSATAGIGTITARLESASSISKYIDTQNEYGFPLINGIAAGTKLTNRWCRYTDGALVSSGNYLEVYTIENKGYKYIDIQTYCDSNSAAIAFYDTDGNYMQSDSVQGDVNIPNRTSIVPDNVGKIIVTNRNTSQPNPKIDLYIKSIGESDVEVNQMDDPTMEILNGYYRYDNKTFSGSLSFRSYKFRNRQYSTYNISVYSGDTVPAAILFYSSSNTIPEECIGSVQMIAGLNNYSGSIPEGTEYIIVVNRYASYEVPSIIFYCDSVSNFVFGSEGIESKTAAAFGNRYWMDKPFYGHCFISQIADTSMPLVPCQSLSDVGIEKRLGFDFIELNVQRTSDNQLIAIHGVGGAFGDQVYHINDVDISSTLINTVTYEYIQQYIRYRAMYEKDRVTIPRLEDVLKECKRQGISVMMTYSEDARVLADKYIGEGEWIAYQGNRATGYQGWIMIYSALDTIEAIVEQCQRIKPPYIHMLNTASFATFKANNTLQQLADAVHATGCLLGLASCYQSTDDNEYFFRNGGDVGASDNLVNFPESGNQTNINGNITFDKFSHNGSVNNGVLTLGIGGTITLLNTPPAVFIGKAQLELKFNGSLKILSFGRCTANTILTNDGTKVIRLSTYFQNASPTFSLEADSATDIYMIHFKSSEC